MRDVVVDQVAHGLADLLPDLEDAPQLEELRVLPYLVRGVSADHVLELVLAILGDDEEREARTADAEEADDVGVVEAGEDRRLSRECLDRKGRRGRRVTRC